jgi:hypothetical protein
MPTFGTEEELTNAVFLRFRFLRPRVHPYVHAVVTP